MLSWLFGSKQDHAPNEALPSYEASREIAEKGDADKRRWLAEQNGLQPEFLYYFATDPDENVRVAVARNTYTPLQADAILAKDESDEVRSELADKICRLLPTLSTDKADKVSEMVLEIIKVLAEDKKARVRRIISEAVKALDHMPQALIEQLVWDAESIVAAPVLEYSPLLNDRQLLEIIRSGIDGGALSAIARRHGLRGEVSAAIAGREDDGATVALLGNQTAEIDETVFLQISEMAQHSDAMLESLIEREDLTVATIRRVASFVGNAVLDKIFKRCAHRSEITEELVRDIRLQVNERIMKGGADADLLPGEQARLRAEKLFGDDKLDESEILSGVKEGERMFVIHALALLTQLSWERVRDVLTSKSGKSIVSMAWKAGLSADGALTLQTKLGALHGSALVKPKGDGGYALSEDDMEWYLDFFG